MKKPVTLAAFFITFLITNNLPVSIFAEPIIQTEFSNAKAIYYLNIDKSLKSFDQIVAASPGSVVARLNLIRILREKGQYQEAIHHLKILWQNKPEERRYRLALLETTYLAGEPEQTLQLSNESDLSAEELYWKGLALMELGKDIEAFQALSDSLVIHPFHPMAHFKLGQLLQKSGNFEKAVTFYRKAAAQDPNLKIVYFPLAQTYIGQGKYLSAYNMLLNAKSAAPWDQQVIAAIKKLLKDHPEMFSEQPTDGQKKQQVITAPQVIPILEEREKISEIRIGLAEKIKRLHLKTGEGFRWSDRSGRTLLKGIIQTVFIVRKNKGRIEILNEQGKLLIKSAGSIFLIYDNPAATSALFNIESGQGKLWAGGENRIYRGRLQFLFKEIGFTVVNRLNLEEYLYGVVPAEMEPHWPVSALEAQAIAARTYAISHLNSYNSRGFDLLPTVASQVYKGVNVEKPTTNAAVDATRGQILIYNGKPISAFYSGNNGGFSASSQDIWGVDIPYLQAKPDKLLSPPNEPLGPEELAEWLISRPQTYSCHPQYSAPSNYRWTAWTSRIEIENRLMLKNKLGYITSITVVGRSLTGVVSKVLIKGKTGEYSLTGDAIRTKLGGLRSNMFIVEPKLSSDGLPEYFIFHGGGWGHGVGMCQSGAAGMAASGFKCEEILNHYYPGVELTKLY